jgi:hypothetical protein
MLVAGTCLLVLLIATCLRQGAKDPPLDPDVVRRIRRCADQVLREQRFPNE